MHGNDFNEGHLECNVSRPQRENESTKDVYISYLVSTKTDYKSFQRPDFSVRRRFTDFLFLYKTLCREYPACAVPPLPEKHKMEYVRGDRFGPDFTERRARSLHRFLKRLTLHPVTRRAALFLIFLESPDWNSTMKARPLRGSTDGGGGSGAGGGGGGSSSSGSAGVFDNFTDTWLNAFSKVHKPDKRFIEVRDRADKLDEDLGHVEKVVSRVVKREGECEQDYADLAAQFHKFLALEPGVEASLTKFSAGADSTAHGFQQLREHMDRDYLGSLRDMEAYVVSIKSLLKTREQKQLDFEGLTDYLTRAASDRDNLASSNSGGMGASNFLRAKIEDVRGVDHEQSRRERVRKLEMQIERLTREVESAKTTSEAFDEEVVKEVADFERIKAVEFKDTLGDLAQAELDFFTHTMRVWETFLEQMEEEGLPRD